jgi:hypothetical protein
MYRIVRFGAVELEHYNQVDVVGSGVTPSAYQALHGGGALDLFGAQQTHPGTVERVKSIRLRGVSGTDLENLYFQLLSLRGKRDRLFRETVSGKTHWMYARLVEVSAKRTFEQAQYQLIQDMDLRFVTQEAFWRGSFAGKWYFDGSDNLDSGLVFDSGESYPLTTSPTEITVSTSDDAGCADVRALIIRVKAGSAAITSITIARDGGESLSFDGTIAAGKSLIVDTGTMQVTNDGVDAYDDLTLSPTADMAVWFALKPGDNPITITFSGGGVGSTVDFSYYEAWY